MKVKNNAFWKIYLPNYNNDLDKYVVQFSHNDSKGETVVEVREDEPVYPVVTFTNRGEKVRIKLGNV